MIPTEKLLEIKKLADNVSNRDLGYVDRFQSKKEMEGSFNEKMVVSLIDELLASRETIGFYAGNFDGKEGSKWNEDTFFIETKFGSSESAGGSLSARDHQRKFSV